MIKINGPSQALCATMIALRERDGPFILPALVIYLILFYSPHHHRDHMNNGLRCGVHGAYGIVHVSIPDTTDLFRYRDN